VRVAGFLMLLLFKPILMSFINSKAVRQLVIDLLKAAAKQSTNTVDDQLVALVERNLLDPNA
jgi:hypothetical protein